MMGNRISLIDKTQPSAHAIQRAIPKNQEMDQVLITAIKESCRPNVVDNAISMGVNVNTKLANTLVLCIQNITKNLYNCLDFLEIVIILLEAGISMEYREEGIKTATHSVRAKTESLFIDDKKAVQVLGIILTILNNAPPPKGRSHMPYKEIACSTAKAWERLLFSQQFSDITYVFEGDEKDEGEPIVRLHAHRNILAASSPYFARYFSQWGTDKKEFETSNSVEIMKTVLAFIYTGQIPNYDEFGFVLPLGWSLWFRHPLGFATVVQSVEFTIRNIVLASSCRWVGVCGFDIRWDLLLWYKVLNSLYGILYWLRPAVRLEFVVSTSVGICHCGTKCEFTIRNIVLASSCRWIGVCGFDIRWDLPLWYKVLN
eukprot:scaffold351_cov148-Amphora_coffeaeformis.AAC.10